MRKDFLIALPLCESEILLAEYNLALAQQEKTLIATIKKELFDKFPLYAETVFAQIKPVKFASRFWLCLQTKKLGTRVNYLL